jgi:Ca2+-binding EF-hand superfamily protein
MRGFILTTKGDLKSKIDYTFRIYDQNGDNQISGEEIKKMANVKEKIRERKKIFFYLF